MFIRAPILAGVLVGRVPKDTGWPRSLIWLEAASPTEAHHDGAASSVLAGKE
jgi:hypothetical protein